MNKVAQESPHESRASALARFFLARPGVWLDGRGEISRIGGGYAWRTRLSDLRRAPFDMRIENRQRTVRLDDGTAFTVSEYRYVPQPDFGRPAAAPVQAEMWR